MRQRQRDVLITASARDGDQTAYPTPVIDCVEMFHGTIDAADVHPREVMKQALRLNAAAVIVSHHHPNGGAEPSAADKTMTSRLRQALALLDIRTLDHLIVAGAVAMSFAEHGLL